MNMLVIGAAGFVGPYLVQEMLSKGHRVAVTKLAGESFYADGAEVYDADVLNEYELLDVFKKTNPDVVYNLAAQSSVALSWQCMRKTFEINVLGALNILNVIRESGRNIRLILVGSGEEYGSLKDVDMPISEVFCGSPRNPYAISKSAQTSIGKMFADAYGMDVIIVRAFNHIGPRQPAGFVVPDFCSQIVAIEKGRAEPVIRVGNLSARRDFTDVRDIVKGYHALSAAGKSGEIYNIGSGKAVCVMDIFKKLISFSLCENISIETDQARFRHQDVPLVEADITKLRQETGWQPVIPLDLSLKETLQFWRDND